MVESLYWIQFVTGCKCRLCRIGRIWSDFSALHTSLAAAFLTFWVCLAYTEGNLRIESYNNLTSREQENKQGLSCLSGEKIPYGSDVPDLYVCSFASVVKVLWHAEIWVQGSTKIFHGHKLDISIFDVNDRYQRSVDRHSNLFLFESMVMTLVFLLFNWSLFLVIQDGHL